MYSFRYTLPIRELTRISRSSASKATHTEYFAKCFHAECSPPDAPTSTKTGGNSSNSRLLNTWSKIPIRASSQNKSTDTCLTNLLFCQYRSATPIRPQMKQRTKGIVNFHNPPSQAQRHH